MNAQPIPAPSRIDHALDKAARPAEFMRTTQELLRRAKSFGPKTEQRVRLLFTWVRPRAVFDSSEARTHPHSRR